MDDHRQEMNERINNLLQEALLRLKSYKPNDRSDMDRCYAVTITEMEKIIAYFQMYAVDNAVEISEL